MYVAESRDQRQRVQQEAAAHFKVAQAKLKDRLADADPSPNDLESIFDDPSLTDESRAWVRKAMLQDLTRRLARN